MSVVLFGHLKTSWNGLSDFSGKVYLTFYDKESSLTTLGTNPSSDTLPFKWKTLFIEENHLFQMVSLVSLLNTKRHWLQLWFF